MFGFYPLYIRQPEDLTPLFQNALIFAACLGVTSLSPLFGEVQRTPTIGGAGSGESGGGVGGSEVKESGGESQSQ